MRDLPRRLTPNRTIGWLASVAMALIAVSVEYYDVLEMRKPWRTIAVIIGVCLAFEVVWRLDLRPSLTWNDAGFSLVGPLRVHQHPWQNVTDIRVRFNEVLIGTTSGELSASFDRVWWISLFSPRRRTAPARIEESLRDSFRSGRQSTGILPPFDAGRPIALVALHGSTLAAILVAASISS